MGMCCETFLCELVHNSEKLQKIDGSRWIATRVPGPLRNKPPLSKPAKRLGVARGIVAVDL